MLRKNGGSKGITSGAYAPHSPPTSGEKERRPS
nr:MAG TPA: hypothetical protein [Caudoviricetes sp.]